MNREAGGFVNSAVRSTGNLDYGQTKVCAQTLYFSGYLLNGFEMIRQIKEQECIPVG